MENNKTILEVKGLKKYFPLNKDIFGRPQTFLRAVDDVTFKLEAGKTIGVVGESGCGKTTLGRTILQLYDTTGGKSLYYGHELEDTLPKYYVEGIKKLPAYKAKYIKALDDFTSLTKDDKKIVKVLGKKATLASYYSVLELVDNSLKGLKKEAKEEIKYYKAIIKALKKIIDSLEASSVITGGAILGDETKIKDSLLSKVLKENDLFKALAKKNNLNRKISKCTDQDAANKVNEDIQALDNTINELQNDVKTYGNQVKALKKEIKKDALFNDLEARREKGLDLARLTKEEMRLLRTEIQLIFQDPYSSLPPRMTIGAILTEAVAVHKIVDKEHIIEHIRKVMKMCGLQPQYYDRYPHEFSGGQRQRICIARALAVNPKLVICDEPVSALDVSIQAQIINLLKELQNDLGLTYMFISHDLSVVKYITDSIIVMYLGNMMEIGDTNDIFDNPLHPYTQALFSAVPVPDPDAKMNRIILKGDIPSPANPPKGCKFHTRCEKCMGVCKFKAPKFIQYDEKHLVACHLYDEEVMANLEKYDVELAEIEAREAQEVKERAEKEAKKITVKKLVSKIASKLKKKNNEEK